LLDLLPYPHLRHAWHIFHQEGLRPNGTDDTDELAIEAITWIVNYSRMVAHLGKGLARRTTDYDVNVASAVQYRLANLIVANVSHDSLCFGKVRGVGSSGVRVVIASGDNGEPSLSKALGKTTRASKKIYDTQWIATTGDVRRTKIARFSPHVWSSSKRRTRGRPLVTWCTIADLTADVVSARRGGDT